MDSTISSLITATEKGDDAAAAALFAALYAELHRLARSQLAKSGGGVSLGVTTLLHEAYLDLSSRDGLSFTNRGQFMGYAARAMRGLIIEHARHRRAQKRGGQFEIISLVADVAESVPDDRELSHISDALDDLARVDPWLAQIVDLKFFCGFTFGEIAAMRDLSERTVQRDWEKARIRLHRALRSQPLSE